MAILETPKTDQTEFHKAVHSLKQIFSDSSEYDKIILACFLRSLTIQEIKTTPIESLLIDYDDFLDEFNEKAPEMEAMPVKREFFEYRVNDLKKLLKDV